VIQHPRTSTQIAQHQNRRTIAVLLSGHAGESIMIAGVNAPDKQPCTVLGRSGRRSVAVAGGGTAGHVTSALAIMSAYQAGFDAEVYFIGCQDGFETQLVPAGGFELHIIPGAPYARQSLFGKARALAALLQGTLTARRLLQARQTGLVIGLGGYASLGPVLAARILGIPAVIHEANVFPGLANRMIASLTDRVFLGWEQAGAAFRKSKTVVTGNPIRPAMASLANQPREQRRDNLRRILVTGGSAGSPFLNANVPMLLARVRDLGVAITIRHQTGDGEIERVRQTYERLGFDARIEAFIDDMAQAYCQADFVITAAGALTLAELALFGLPALLVPLTVAAQGHQIANAKIYAEQAGGAWVPEHDWDTEPVARLVATTLADFDGLSAQAQRLRRMATPDAAQMLVEECEALLDGVRQSRRR
jgi:UDP-N-acetylglucosamine--N-acetylmuramyl-(pentapeptide) pyrophosphoryl-undecaprenol N-acetylglucosamine transferase